jgi:predicted extracellular nuclease
LRGFFVQEEDADADAEPATSEGIFVFCSSCPTALSVGDKVRVTGSASEFFDMSQLSATTAASVTLVSSGNPLPTPASIQLPVPGVPTGDLVAATTAINAYFEPFEGMLVTFPDTLSVSEYFELARYGQVILSEGGHPRQFTDENLPSVTGYIDHRIDLATRRIILDDTDNRENRPVDTPNTAYYHPVPGLSTSNFFRGGDTITNLTGVLHWSFAGGPSPNAWRIRPVTEAYSYAFSSVNARPSVPNVGGNTKVASFNVLNYFLTVDTTSSNDVGSCGASGTLDCRGPDSTAERDRQQAKLTAALVGLNADVFGLIELENTPNVDPLAEIVSDLNAATAPGTYAAVNTGLVGSDAIKAGLIYKPGAVTPIGAAMIDNDPVFSRPPVAQLFETTDGGRFTVVINHFKSKGCTDATGADLDQNDGQSCYNAQRVSQALALVDFVNDIASQTGDPDVLIIGDLNSYAKEDPITTLENAGLTNLVATLAGPGAYSYLFDGQLGYLDHALSTSSLTPQVTGVADWHINADEIPLFDYNDDVRDTGEASFEEESDVLPLYEANEFRTSDHDPVVIGMNVNAPPTVDAGGPYSVNEGSSVTVSATGSDPNGDPLTYAWDLDNNGSFETSGQSALSAASRRSQQPWIWYRLADPEA